MDNLNNANLIEELKEEALSNYSVSQNLYHMGMDDLANKLMDDYLKQYNTLLSMGVNIDNDICSIDEEAQKRIIEYRTKLA